jgi:hypothetical protein
MARTVSLTTLQNRTLQRANLEVASNAAIYSSTELVDNINEGIAELHRLVTNVPGQPFYLNSVNFNTSQGTDTYPIGPSQVINCSDFMSAKGFDVQFGQNIVNTARPFMWSERNRFKILYAGWVYTQPVFYRLLGKTSSTANSALDSVKFIPMPSGTFTITMWYLPVPVVLVNGSDVLDGIAGFEELVVLSAATKLLIKQEQFEHAQMLMSERARQEEQILAMLTHDSEAPERVTDVTLNDDGFLGRAVY